MLNKNILVTFAACLFVTALALIYLWKIYPQRKYLNYDYNPTLSPTINPGENRDLLLYQNPQIGINFYYPGNFIQNKTNTLSQTGVKIDSFTKNSQKTTDGFSSISIDYNPQNCETFYRLKLMGSTNVKKITPEYLDAGLGITQDIEYFYTRSTRNDENYASFIFNYSNFCPNITFGTGKNSPDQIDQLSSLMLSSLEFSKKTSENWSEYNDNSLPFTLHLPQGYQSSPQSDQKGFYSVEIGSTLSANSIFQIESVAYSGNADKLVTDLEVAPIFKAPLTLAHFPPTSLSLDGVLAYLSIKDQIDIFFTHKNHAYNIKFLSLQSPYVYKILHTLKFK